MNEEGAYIVEKIRSRCTEDGDCLIWRGPVAHSGHPQQSGSVRRIMWKATLGEIPKGKRITVSCRRARCLSHLELTTASEIATRINASAAVRARKAITSAAAARARLGKLDMDKARLIRSSDRTCKDLAEEFGVHFSLISAVRVGKAWKEPSPFAGLGARA